MPPRSRMPARAAQRWHKKDYTTRHRAKLPGPRLVREFLVELEAETANRDPRKRMHGRDPRISAFLELLAAVLYADKITQSASTCGAATSEPGELEGTIDPGRRLAEPRRRAIYAWLVRIVVTRAQYVRSWHFLAVCASHQVRQLLGALLPCGWSIYR